MPTVPNHDDSPPHMLLVLPALRDDAAPAVKNAIALRRRCDTEGRCPACGAEPIITTIGRGLHIGQFEHEDTCPAVA